MICWFVARNILFKNDRIGLKTFQNTWILLSQQRLNPLFVDQLENVGVVGMLSGVTDDFVERRSHEELRGRHRHDDLQIEIEIGSV